MGCTFLHHRLTRRQCLRIAQSLIAWWLRPSRLLSGGLVTPAALGARAMRALGGTLAAALGGAFAAALGAADAVAIAVTVTVSAITVPVTVASAITAVAPHTLGVARGGAAAVAAPLVPTMILTARLALR